MPGSNEYSMGPEESRTSSTLARKQTAKPSPFYKERDFRQTKLKEMYGANPTKRQVRKFNRYVSSDQGQADELAFVKDESRKFLDSVSAYGDSVLNRIRAANQELALRARQATPPAAPPQAGQGNAGEEDSKGNDGGAGNGQDSPVAPPVAPPTVPAPPTPAGPVENPQNNTVPFDLQAFASDKKLRTRVIDGKTYARYDPFGDGDYWIGEDGTPYMAGMFGVLGIPVAKWIENHTGRLGYDAQVKHNTSMMTAINDMITGYKPSQTYMDNSQRQAAYKDWERQYILDHPISKSLAGSQDWGIKFAQAKKAAGFKQGGPMNKINYFQQGGAAPQQDMQKQIVALVQAAMQGDQKATQTVNKIIEAAKAGDQQAAQLAQMIQQVAQQMQGQTVAAKYGAKLNYLQSLKCGGKTKAKKKEKGGKVCPECEQTKKVEMKACGGKQARKRYFGGNI